MKKVTFALAAALTFGGIGTVATTASAESNGLDKDCSDFKGQPYQAVVDYWNSKGYTATNDPERLDGWGNKVDDGIPCEAPSDYDTSKINGIGKKEEATSEETTKEETTEEQPAKEETATKEDNSSSEQKTTSDKKEGEELPETASNNPLGVAAGLAVAAAGVVLFTRRKNSKA
ncbi:cell wall anchor protein [Priestia megaterium]|uniref:Cell wall anchor protein n=2 Tax=Priestia megaterium TaxID=1404 RepID=A0AAE5P5A2_PRIMG|nr:MULTISPECIES: LPXTG cell wall anchor domain-containing protein [Priestia]RFB21797.1 LPXTG cell wall anchor domain-containing protein [Bacillus sp. ALD]RFB34357.1 LPXTG cell wall anchor domain-containing protein [Bacillus sp. RC]MCR8866080.1 LPXTG cell wall anchor domain-containing protein [Priestia megaterium]MDC7783618.1 LPXTG cell wall anchor domain-containing protein [Priestia megaterium]MDN3232997.1 LPXTG cell wall anchor domain-containing protein [Priestia megaterium]